MFIKIFFVIPLFVLVSGDLNESHSSTGKVSENRIIDRKIEYLTRIKGLRTFWTFQEPPGEDRKGRGPFPYPLREDGGEIQRADEGIFGRYSASLVPGQRFRIPRGEFPGLDFHGHQNLSIVAWIKRKPFCNFENYTAWDSVNPCCEFVAGVFNESSKHRQYGMFLNLHSFNSSDQVCGLISDNGGDTPGHKGCVTGSFGRTKIDYFHWYCIGITYDNFLVKSYVNGWLDYRQTLNPFRYPNGIFDGGPNGADFTVGGNSAFGKKHNYLYGQIGGVAVFDRALKGEKMRRICKKTRGVHKVKKLKNLLDYLENLENEAAVSG